MANPSEVKPEKVILGYFLPKDDRERFIASWLKSDLNTDIILTSKENEAKPKIGIMLINPESYSGLPTLIHESVHMWLAIKRPGYSNDYLRKKPANLNFLGDAKRYRLLTGLVVTVAIIEDKLPPSQAQELEKIFGKSEEYDLLNQPGKSLLDLPSGRSWVGNLVDETSTLGFPESKGHPMQNYHEFLASFITTIAFDGDVLLEKLGAFKELSKKGEPYKGLYSSMTTLLNEAQADATMYLNALKASSKSQSLPLPQIQRMELNLAKLQDAMAELQRR